MTIMEALRWANNRLKKTGIDSPMLDAEVLLSDILGVSKSWLFGHFNDPLKTHQEEKFCLWIDRRAKREPIAYITEKKAFYKRDMYVNPYVLIPRPATETMVNEAVACFKDQDDNEGTIFCDIGTGSGAIGVTLAAETQTPVLATDMSKQALTVAQKNAQKHNATELVDFRHGNLAEPIIQMFRSLRESGDPKISSVYPYKHMIICANLPYLKDNQLETVETEVLFEPKEALVSGVDGLDDYWKLFKQLSTFRHVLPRRLTTMIEIDPDQTKNAKELIEHIFPHSKPSVAKDLQGNNRIITAEL